MTVMAPIRQMALWTPWSPNIEYMDGGARSTTMELQYQQGASSTWEFLYNEEETKKQMAKSKRLLYAKTTPIDPTRGTKTTPIDPTRGTKTTLIDPMRGTETTLIDPTRGTKTTLIDPTRGTKTTLIDPTRGTKTTLIDPTRGTKTTLIDPMRGTKTTLIDPTRGTKTTLIDPTRGTKTTPIDPTRGTKTILIDPTRGTKTTLIDPTRGTKTTLIDPTRGTKTTLIDTTRGTKGVLQMSSREDRQHSYIPQSGEMESELWKMKTEKTHNTTTTSLQNECSGNHGQLLTDVDAVEDGEQLDEERGGVFSSVDHMREEQLGVMVTPKALGKAEPRRQARDDAADSVDVLCADIQH